MIAHKWLSIFLALCILSLLTSHWNMMHYKQWLLGHWSIYLYMCMHVYALCKLACAMLASCMVLPLMQQVLSYEVIMHSHLSQQSSCKFIQLMCHILRGRNAMCNIRWLQGKVTMITHAQEHSSGWQELGFKLYNRYISWFGLWYVLCIKIESITMDMETGAQWMYSNLLA